MKLKKLLDGLEIASVTGKTDCEIRDVVTDSNAVTRGSLFVCINGGERDGHDYVRQAERYGAAAVVTEKNLETGLTQIIVKNTRKAVSELAAAFYGHADKKMRIIGVLGTNGKTTTSHFITSVLASAGVKCGLIGTSGVYYDGKYIEPTLTTPDPLVLHKILAEMSECGVEAVVTEVSAHAVYYDKVYGISFESAVFTGFSQDHLDFFGTMENYKRAKLKFFKEYDYKYAVVNVDDELGREITEIAAKPITYGLNNPSDVFAIDVKDDGCGQRFVINLFDCIYDTKINLIGSYNVYNALAAATACALYGIKPKAVICGLENLKGVDGRLENVYSGDFSVYLDYAHTPDGLEKALTALRGVCKNRLICVFGCGGNRDVTKRPVMGKISGELADFTVITTDNPRFEEPMDIIWQIEKGVLAATKKYVIVQDRKDAVEYAIRYAGAGDVVLIAGKGNEKYQEVFGIKRMYNDKATVEEILGKCKG